MPDREQEIAVRGPLTERVTRAAREAALRVLRFAWKVFTLPLRQLREEVEALRAASVESLAYVGIEMRRLGDLVERGGAGGQAPAANGARPAAGFRELAGVEAPGPVLVVGGRGPEVAPSLTSAGYEVEIAAGGLETGSASAERRFAAALILSDGPALDPGEVERISERLADGAPVVIALRAGVNGAGAGGHSAGT